MFLVRFNRHRAFNREESFVFVTDSLEKAKAISEEKIGEALDYVTAIVGKEAPRFENGVEYRGPIYDTTGEYLNAVTSNHGMLHIRPIDVL